MYNHTKIRKFRCKPYDILQYVKTSGTIAGYDKIIEEKSKKIRIFAG